MVEVAAGGSKENEEIQIQICEWWWLKRGSTRARARGSHTDDVVGAAGWFNSATTTGEDDDGAEAKRAGRYIAGSFRFYYSTFGAHLSIKCKPGRFGSEKVNCCCCSSVCGYFLLGSCFAFARYCPSGKVKRGQIRRGLKSILKLLILIRDRCSSLTDQF